jgi:hypothetical protein
LPVKGLQKLEIYCPGDTDMNVMYQVNPEVAQFDGYVDLNGQFIPFSMADEVFTRARAIGARVLLRLELNEEQELTGIFYTNDNSLCA